MEIATTSQSPKCETSFVKKPCKVRRTTSLYIAIKKIKSNKKPRQIINRKSSKTQNSSNPKPIVQNNSLLSKIQCKTQLRVKKKFSKTAEFRPSVEANCLEEKCTAVKTKRRKSSVKQTTTNNLQHQNSNAEITTVVKQGSKRLKVVSPKLIMTRSEIGESPSANILDKKTKATSSKTLYLCNKPKTKGTFIKSRKQCLKAEQTKPKKSSKLKIKNRNKTEANDSSSTQISSDTSN